MLYSVMLCGVVLLFSFLITMFICIVTDIGCCASMGNWHPRRNFWHASVADRSNCYTAALWTCSCWSASCSGNGILWLIILYGYC